MDTQKHSSSGQAIVEFALVFPLLLILLLGIIEFGLLFYNKAVITNASREGARVGIVNQDRGNLNPINANILGAVNNYCGSRLISFGSPDVTVTPDWSAGTGFGHPLRVTVTFDYRWLVLPNFVGLPNPTRLSGVTVMRLE